MNKKIKKTALITGASKGIGYELSRLFAQDGYNLVLISRSRERLEKISGELEEKYNIFAKIIVKDLSKPTASREIFDETYAEGIKIDILVNSAGFGSYGYFIEQDIQNELRMIQVNITSLTQLTYFYANEMKKNRGGKILNISSAAAFVPGPMMAVYYASKAYVLHFSEALANEFKKDNIIVTTFCPGTTKSDFHQNAGVEINRWRKLIMMNTEDVAKAGYKALKEEKRIVIPGIRNKILTFGGKIIPKGIASNIKKAIK